MKIIKKTGVGSVARCDKQKWGILKGYTLVSRVLPGFKYPRHQFITYYYSCDLSTATIEYSCPSVCLCVCVSVCLSVYTITKK